MDSEHIELSGRPPAQGITSQMRGHRGPR
jgi:hypothetical protein